MSFMVAAKLAARSTLYLAVMTITDQRMSASSCPSACFVSRP